MDRMKDRLPGAHERHERARTLSNEVAEQLRNGNPNPEELKRKLEGLRLLRNERRHDQRAFLRQRWGNTVDKPDVKQELELHARRLARLQRLEVVVATERTGDQRKRLIARIERMRALENKRHETAMTKLVPEGASPPQGSASAPAALPAPPPPPTLPTPPAAPAPSGGSL